MHSARHSAARTIRHRTGVTTAARPTAAATVAVQPWQPLLTGGLRDRALRAVDALGQALAADCGQQAGPTAAALAPGLLASGPLASGPLASGAAGLAVCLAVTASTRGDERAAGLAWACQAAARQAQARHVMPAALYSGFPGVAWAADFVGGLLPGRPTDDPNAAIDSAGIDSAGIDNAAIDAVLASTLRRYPDSGPYGLADGLTGLGAYALARWPRPAAADCLAAVIERLAGRARRDGNGVYWWTPPSATAAGQARRHPGGGVDLTAAHGMAGPIALLGRAHALGVEPRTVRPLLDGAVRWLLAHQAGTGADLTVPGFVADAAGPAAANAGGNGGTSQTGGGYGGASQAASRLAWCDGDPGVALALLLAARDVGEPAWALAATRLALAAAARSPGPGCTLSADRADQADQAGICHGAAGLAHVFGRLYQLTGAQALAEAAITWAERTVALCEAGWAAAAGVGLLDGAAGVVLVLLACCQQTEPDWDQPLFISTGRSGAGR